MAESEEEFDPYLIELVDEVFKIEETTVKPNFDKLFNLVGPAPLTVPKLLNLKPSEFMTAPFEHFTKLCEEHNYSKVISSLTYIRNVASNGDESVINRAVSLQEDLKHWRTTASTDDQNKPDDQTEQTISPQTE